MKPQQASFIASNKRWIGAALLLYGLLLVASRIYPDLAVWDYTWPVILISFSVLIGVRKGLGNIGFWVFFSWGIFLLADRVFPSLNLDHYTGPFLLILLGMFFIFRKKTSCRREWMRTNEQDGSLNITVAFSSSTRKVYAEDLRNGDITCFMGHAEIDLTQAKFEGEAHIDLTAVVSKVTLIFPKGSVIKSDLSAVMSDVDDKRMAAQDSVTSKVFVLDGTALMSKLELVQIPY